MSCRQNEPVAIYPLGIARIEAEMSAPQNVRERRECHRRARVSGIRLLHSIHGQNANRVDAEVVECG